VTRGQLPQGAGSLGLNGGGAAAAVPPRWGGKTNYFEAKCVNISKKVGDTSKVTVND